MATIKTRVRKIFAPYILTSSDEIIWRDLTAGTSGTSGYPIVGIGNGDNLHRFNIDLTQYGYNEGDIVDLWLDIDPTKITRVNRNFCSMIEADFSDAPSLNYWSSYPHPELRKLSMPTNPTVSLADFQLISTGIEGVLDLSTYTNTTTTLDINTYYSTNLTNVLLPSTTNIDYLAFNVCNLTGTFDMSPIDGFTNLNVSNNPLLTTLIFKEAAAQAAGGINFSNTGVSGVIDLSGYDSVGVITGNNTPSLDSILFSTSGTATSNITLDVSGIRSLDLSNNTAVRSIVLTSCGVLDDLVLPRSSSTNTVTFTLDNSRLANVGVLDASGIHITTTLSVEYTNLEGIIFEADNNYDITTLDIRVNPFVGTLDLSMFNYAREFELEYLYKVDNILMPTNHTNSALTKIEIRLTTINELDLSGFKASIGSLQLYYNRNLKTIIWPDPMPIIISIFAHANQLTGDLDLTSTEGLIGTLELHGENEIINVYGPINKPMARISIKYCTNITTIDMSSISTFKTQLYIYRNPTLETLLLPAVVSDEITELEIVTCPSLTSDFDFTNYTGMKTEFIINYVPTSNIILPQSGASLTNSYTYFYIISTLVSSVDLSNYTGTITNLSVTNNQNCTSIICPYTTTVGHINFQRNPITSLDVTTFNGYILDQNTKYIYISYTELDKNATQQVVDDVDAKTQSGLTGRRFYAIDMPNVSTEDVTEIQGSASYTSLVSKGFTFYW